MVTMERLHFGRMRSSRSTWLNSDPLVSSVPRISTPAVITPRMNHVLKPLSRQDDFSDLIKAGNHGSATMGRLNRIDCNTFKTPQ